MDTQMIRRFVRMHRAIAIHLVVIVVAVLGIFFGIIPAFKQVAELFEETRTLTSDIDRMNEKIAILDSYEMGFLEQGYANVQAALPEEKSIDTFLSTIETVAGKQGLSIDSFNLEKLGTIGTASAVVQKTPGASTVRATAAVLGDLSNIRNFLEQVVKVRRLVRVDDINVSFLKTKQTLNADVILEGFYQPLPKVLGKASDTIEPLSEKQLSTLQAVSAYPVAYQQVPVSAAAGEPQQPASVNPFNPNPE